MKLILNFLAIGALFLLIACGGSADSSNVTTDNTEVEDLNDDKSKTVEKEEEPEPKTPEYRKNLQTGNWYTGTIGEHKVWFHFGQVAKIEGFDDDAQIHGVYGYQSTKGAGISFSGELNGNTLDLKVRIYTNDHEEDLNLKHDPTSGKITGTWKSKGKELPVELESKTTVIEDFKTLLKQLPTAQKFPLVIGPGREYRPKTLAQFYQDYHYNYEVDFLSKYVPYAERSIDDEEQIPTTSKGRFILKTKLDANHYALFFRTDFEKENDQIIGDAYMMEEKGVLVVAIVDEDGNLKKSVRIGNDPQSMDATYLDFNARLTAKNRLEIYLADFMMMQGRHFAGGRIQRYEFGPSGFEFLDEEELGEKVFNQVFDYN